MVGSFFWITRYRLEKSQQTHFTIRKIMMVFIINVQLIVKAVGNIGIPMLVKVVHLSLQIYLV